MARHEVVAEAVDGGFCFDIHRTGMLGMGRRRVPLGDWEPGMHPAASLLKLLLESLI